MSADPNQVVLTGENPFIRLSDTDGGPQTTNASYWRIITCPAGPGHVLYLKSELTENRWRIWSDNITHTIMGYMVLTPEKRRECRLTYVDFQHYFAAEIEKRRQQPTDRLDPRCVAGV